MELLVIIAKEAFESGIHYGHNEGEFKKFVDGYLTRHDLPMDSGKICSDVRSCVFTVILDKLKPVAHAYIEKYKCVPESNSSETYKHYVKFMTDNVPDKFYHHDKSVWFTACTDLYRRAYRAINDVNYIKGIDYRKTLNVIRRECGLADIDDSVYDDYTKKDASYACCDEHENTSDDEHGAECEHKDKPKDSSDDEHGAECEHKDEPKDTSDDEHEAECEHKDKPKDTSDDGAKYPHPIHIRAPCKIYVRNDNVLVIESKDVTYHINRYRKCTIVVHGG
jgi:hypothetical protein